MIKYSLYVCVCVSLAATKLPVVQLNFAAVSQGTQFSRDVVEGCVRETLLLLFRALASEQDIFLTFQGIGVLSFKNNKVAQLLICISQSGTPAAVGFLPHVTSFDCCSKVRMKFSRGFIDATGGTGRPLSNNVGMKTYTCVCVFACVMNVLLQRPESGGSSLSGGPSRLQRTLTANPVTLPTVCSPQPDNKAGDKDAWCSSPAPDQRNAGGERAYGHKAQLIGFPAEILDEC